MRRTVQQSEEKRLQAYIREDLESWLRVSPTGPEAWLFPSEKLDKPLSRDNVLRRYIRPRLKTVGLEWVDFQVMRRTHSSKQHERGEDPKTVADQMGHDVNVNLNVYTQTPIEIKLEAVKRLESAFVN
jgi:integrase